MILDLFAGPGGWSEGIRRYLGLIDVGLEWDTAACRTRAAAGHTTIQCDVARYPTEPFKGRVKGAIKSPPCQAWSRAGKGLGLVDQPLVHQAVHDLAQGRDTRAALLTACKDPRSLLAAEPMRWLHDLRPEWVAMEEVVDVLPLWKQYAIYLREWGYSVWTGILNAADYGVPQTRRRAILIASRVRAVTAPEPTHAQHAEEATLFGAGRDRWVTMAEALNLTGNQALRNGNQPNAAIRATDEPAPTMAFGNNSARIEWLLHTNRDQRPDGSRQVVDPAVGPAPTFTAKSGGQWALRNGTQQNAAVRNLNEPAGTLFFGGRCNDVSWVRERPATTVCATDRIAPPGHRDRSPSGESQFASPDTVRITVQEAAILQSFPCDYPWQGTKTKQFEQIGNAVPPLLAAHVVSAATGIPMQLPAPVEEPAA